MRALLLSAALLAGAQEPPSPPMTLPEAAPVSRDLAFLRSGPDASTLPVSAGTQVAARILGPLVAPATDPGRTLIQVELVMPLLARSSRTVLLPAGTRLVGRVHLLAGRYRFIDFQSLVLPDGRPLPVPEDTLRLGPGRLLATQDGTPALVTVIRPLRVEVLAQP
jgi:hypothetical protein